MRSFFSIIFLLFIGTYCHAQHVYQIKADSVRIYNTCDTAELILENRTQKVPGFLFNKGAGRTEFQKLKLKAVSPSRIAILGQDTLDLSTLSGIGSGSLQDVTTIGNRTSNEMMITGNALSNTDKGLHLSFDPITNSSKIANVDINGNPNTTLINMGLHNLEFFTQTGYRVLGLNDQQSTGLAGANFNCRVRGESALLNNEFPILGQVMDSINAHTKDAAPGNIPLSTVLLNGSQANNNINLGASGQTTQYGLNVTRTIAGADYKATYAVTANGSAYMGVTSGASARVIDVPAALTYARYSSDGGNTYYQIWDANAHPAGNTVNPTLTGANVLAGLSVNSAGHITAATTRALLASDISAAPASGSANYIQNQTTAAQSGVGFWTAGNGIANSLRTTAPIGQGDILLFNGGGITNANLRWAIYKRTAETGTGNVGSDFAIGRYTDAGALIDNPLSINRSTGEVALSTINNEATDVDKFLVSNGGVLRYRTGAQTLADIGAAPLSGAGNYIQNGTAAQTANFNITGNGTFGSLASFAGGLQYTNATSNLENFGTAGVNAPTFTTRSAGTKTVWYSALSGTNVDFATGVETGALWNSVPQANTSYSFKWYGGSTLASQLWSTGQQEWVGQGRFKGWYTAGSGPALELGVTANGATVLGYDRTSPGYIPLILQGGTTGTSSFKMMTINGVGYQLNNFANAALLGTDASGYLVDKSADFAAKTIPLSTVLANGNTSGNSLITFNKNLSATNQLMDLQQGYGVYSDTLDILGNTGTRVVVDAPNNGTIGLGPRTGANFLSRVQLKANNIRLWGPSNKWLSVGALGTDANGDLINVAANFAPVSGSGNYIQNQSASSQAASFNISGTGLVQTASNSAWALNAINNGTTNAHGLYVNIGSGSTGIPFRVDKNGVPQFTIANGGEVTIANIANESTDVDKFLVSNAGAIRYRTGAQALSDMGAAPSSGGYNYIQNGLTAQTANLNITGLGTFGSVASFAGDIQLTNGTSNVIRYIGVGYAAPTLSTRSVGTKIVYDPTLSPGTVDYATGIESGYLWNSVWTNSNTVGFKWYGGTTPVARLDGLGSLELVGQGRFRGWYTANGTGPAAELGFSGGVATLYGFDRTASIYTTLRLGGGSTATGRYFDIDGTGYKFTNLPNTKLLGTNALGYVIDNSAAFIQNGTGVQASSNFNISGAGVIGTTLNVGGQTTLNTVSVSGTTNMTGALTASGGVSTTALKMKEGTANATMGVANFGSGVISVTVNTTAVTANSRIFLTPVVSSTSPIAGMTAPCLGPRVAGTSFTIFWTKEAVSSTGSVEWMIVEPY